MCFCYILILAFFFSSFFFLYPLIVSYFLIFHLLVLLTQMLLIFKILFSIPLVQPSILIAPLDLDLIPGSTAFLNCTAIGSPTPQSSWTRTSLITGLTESLDVIGPSYFQLSNGLQLSNVGRNDSALYDCHSENALGRISNRATVRVEGEIKDLAMKHALIWSESEYV